MNIKIRIENSHIARGQYANAYGCPLALAVAEAIPLAAQVGCDHHRIELTGSNGEECRIPIPAEAQNFPARFDSWKRGGMYPRPKPIEFELDVPEQFLPKEPIRTNRELVKEAV